MIAIFVLFVLVLFIVTMLAVSAMKSTLRDLRQEFARLNARVGELERAQPPAHDGESSLPPSTPLPAAVPAGAVHSATGEPAISSPLPAPPLSPVPAPPVRSRAEWEALIGGKFLNRIGALALIIGMGFFLKYAFDKNWISEWLRVGIGATAGVMLLVGGRRSHRKDFQLFAQGLVGAGIAILYLSVYATFNFYHLVSQPVAFILMVGVTVLAFTQAFLYEAMAVSLLGWLGGFLTPFLLSTGEAHPVALFTYLAMLDLGLIAVLTVRRSWNILAPLSLAATFIIYYLWYVSGFSGTDLGVALTFLTIFWALFFAWDVLTGIRDSVPATPLRTVTSIGAAVLYYPGMYALLDAHRHGWLAPATLALAAVYASSAWFLQRSSGRVLPPSIQYAITAIVLLVTGTEIACGDHVVIAVYAFEAVALVWIGRSTSLKHVWGMGLAVLYWGCIVLLFTENTLYYTHVSEYRLLWNVRTAAFLALIVATGMVVFRLREEVNQSRFPLHAVLHGTWTFLLFLLITVETGDFFRRLALGGDETQAALALFQRQMTLGMLWLLLGTSLLTIGQRRAVVPLLVSGCGMIVLGTCLAAIRGIAFDPIAAYTFLLNYRAAVLVLSCGLLAWCFSRMHGEWPLPAWENEIRLLLRILLVAVPLVLVSAEIRDYYEQAISLRDRLTGENTADLENLKQMFLSTSWLVFSIGLMGIGIVRRVRALRVIAIVLFGVAILKIFFYDLSFLETIYRIVSFIGLGVILLAVSYLYQRFRDVILHDTVGS